MCGGGDIPSKIVDPFKKLVGLDEKTEYYTIGHWVGMNPHYLNACLFSYKGDRSFSDSPNFYEGRADDPHGLWRKTQPYKLVLDKDLCHKLHMIVLVRSEGTTEWSELEKYVDYYLRNYTVGYEENGTFYGGVEKKRDFKKYAYQFNLSDEQKKKVDVYYEEYFSAKHSTVNDVKTDNIKTDVDVVKTDTVDVVKTNDIKTDLN